VAAWAASRIKHFSGWGSNPKCIGYERAGKIVGAVVYHNFTPANVFASIAMACPITRRFLYAMFYCPFEQWGVRHISSAIEASNLESIRLCSHMGFIPEGRMRESAINGEDVILMGMLKSECRWLGIKVI
jgi:RimJ/RimL family protein N-acetyltransferase